jgi:SMC interacting uncharacterized protein involved in chromosome segregation
LGAAFWQAANPKGDLNQVKSELRDDLVQTESRIEKNISDVKYLADNKLLAKDEHDEFVVRINKDIDVLRDEINRIRNDIVSRSEHQQHWTDIDERIAAVRQTLNDFMRDQTAANDEMRKEFGGTYTAGDQLKNLQEQIKAMQSRLDTVAEKAQK